MNIFDAYVIIPVNKKNDFLHNHHRMQFRKEKHQGYWNLKLNSEHNQRQIVYSYEK